MSSVTELKSDLQVEAFKSGSAASEAAVQAMAENIQFINKTFEGPREFTLNGQYWRVPGAQTGVDGGRPCFTNLEIVGLCMWNLVAGSSGTIEFDIIRHFVGGGSASIFTTKPAIPYTAGNDSRIIYDFVNLATLFSSAGITVPVLTSTDLDAGDFLTLNVTQKQSFGEDAGLYLSVRPRN